MANNGDFSAHTPPNTDHDPQGQHDRSHRPLAGVVMCCTSIPPEQRSDLAAVASQMGAIHKLDLTSDVTHLIVGDTDTPKYKYVAKERPDVKCLLPEWVDAVRQSWMEGGDTDVEALEFQHKLPTFAGLRVCVTGFEDLIVRKKLEDAVKNNGAEYRGDLTKEVSHLIAYKPAGNKYNFAKAWGIRVVSIEWLQQSLERGMILDENLYDPQLSPAERGRDAWVRRAISTSSLAKRPRDEEFAPAPARKLRRTASARLSNDNDGIWTDIAQRTSGVTGRREDEWEERRDEKVTPAKKGDGEQHSPEPSLRGADDIDCALNRQSKIVPSPVTESVSREYPSSRGLFSGKRFHLHGFDVQKTNVLEHHLRSHDAEVFTHLDDFSRQRMAAENDSVFLVVPHTSSDHDIPSTPHPVPKPIVVTDMWIELCLHRKRYVHPQANVTSSPFRYPVPGFELLSICCTAFEGVDLLQASKVIKLMGASYDEYLTKDISVLVCNDSSLSRDKIRHALEWGIPAVKAGWLWDCLRSGRRKSFDAYLIQPGTQLERSIKETRAPVVSASSTLRSQRLELRAGAEKKVQSKDISVNPKYCPREKEPKTEQRQNYVSTETAQGDSAGPEVKTANCPRDPCPLLNAVSSEKSNLLDESLDHDGLAATVSQRLDAGGIPLQEISTNSPPKLYHNSGQPPKSMKSLEHEAQNDSLTTAISSLLAHHQRDVNRPPRAKVAETTRLGRRKRQLFGRAPSNLSACSNGSANLSRASSVDTMNTDGLGTPLDTAHLAAVRVDCDEVTTASLLANLDDDENEKAEEKLPSTQLGYEDPEAGAWRERLMNRMGSGNPGASGRITTPKAKSIGTVKDAMDMGLQSVSRRTRHAGGR
ncbi:hypothetical protein MMC11_004419 [Xylographa trunciseda]|nr:hypothetical protein [Xylographa trunciseda]